MDPFLRITIGDQTLKTETAENQGKTPIWKSHLSFKLTSDQVAHITDLYILIEALDEDSATKSNFLGSTKIRASQLKLNAEAVNTITLADAKGQSVGTIDLKADLSQPSQADKRNSLIGDPISRSTNVPSQSSPSQPDSTLALRPLSGKFLKDIETFSQDGSFPPYNY